MSSGVVDAVKQGGKLATGLRRCCRAVAWCSPEGHAFVDIAVHPRSGAGS
jgi:hypothetical protein